MRSTSLPTNQQPRDPRLAKHRITVLLPAALPAYQHIQQSLVMRAHEHTDFPLNCEVVVSPNSTESLLDHTISNLIATRPDLIVSVGPRATRLMRTRLNVEWDEIAHLAIATGDLKHTGMLHNDDRQLLPGTAAIEVKQVDFTALAEALHQVKPTMKKVAVAVTNDCGDGQWDEALNELRIQLRYRKAKLVICRAASVEQAASFLHESMHSGTVDTIICPENSLLTRYLPDLCITATQHRVTVCAGGPPSMAELGPAIIYGTDCYRGMGHHAISIVTQVLRGVRSIDSFGVTEFKRHDTLFLNMMNNECLAQGLDHEHLQDKFRRQPQFARVLR